MTHRAWAADRGVVAAILLLLTLATADVAHAQDVVVDGEIVSAYDIEQRTRFDILATHKTPSREQVLDELRRETLSLHEARRRLGGVADAAVDQAYANMAVRMHLTAEQLTQALAKQGIDARTLKRRIRANLAWAQSLRARMGLVPSTDPALHFGPSPRPEPPTDPRWCLPCFPDNDALFWSH